jgi:hypothetical protein
LNRMSRHGVTPSRLTNCKGLSAIPNEPDVTVLNASGSGFGAA